MKSPALPESISPVSWSLSVKTCPPDAKGRVTDRQPSMHFSWRNASSTPEADSGSQKA